MLAVQHFHCGRDAPRRFPDFGDFYILVSINILSTALTILNDYIVIDVDYVMLSFAKSFD